MASNATVYKDQTPAAALDKATLNKMVWRSLMLQASFNYERMQAAGWEYTILPGLEKIHTNKEDLAASMGHNLEFFNTHPFLVTLVAGIVLGRMDIFLETFPPFCIRFPSLENLCSTKLLALFFASIFNVFGLERT